MFVFAKLICNSAQMMDWQDLRYVLAVGRCRTLSEAARKLGVNHSTVLRRIRRIETDLSTRLFDRHHDGYSLTAAGEEAFDLAQRIEEDSTTLEVKLAMRDVRLSGSIRVTTTDTLWFTVLGDALKKFSDMYPEISLEVVLSNEFVNLNKRHADVAIRPATSPPPSLFGRKISDIAFAAYGSQHYLSDQSAQRNLQGLCWLVPDESMSYIASETWLHKKIPDAEVALRLNSVFGMYSAARAGIGLAVLPCYVGDTCPELQRIGSPADELRSELWLLTHDDHRHVARIRAFLNVFGEELSARRDLIEGRSLNC